MSARALGLLLGFAADRVLGDPQRHHPVAGFGTLASRWEKQVYADNRMAGVGYAASLIGGTTVAAVLLDRIAARALPKPVVTTLLTAAGTWTVLGGTSLDREARAVRSALTRSLDAGRKQVGRLVGRRTDQLSEGEVARAAVESVAENTSDAVVAPLVWGAVAGLPGLLGYRAANTLDAMVGHHNARYEHFGWAAARFDDLVNLVPARLAGVLTAAVAPSGRRAEAWRVRRTFGSLHPSPNAGQVESAFAGALGVTLGGANDYGGQVEHRPTLGDGRAVIAEDIDRAADLARRVDLAAVLTCAALAWVLTRRRRRV